MKPDSPILGVQFVFLKLHDYETLFLKKTLLEEKNVTLELGELQPSMSIKNLLEDAISQP